MSDRIAVFDARLKAQIASTTDLDWFLFYLRHDHRCTPEDLEPTSSRGCWRRKEACTGQQELCPVRGRLHDPKHHTIYYTDTGRDSQGRWISPYRTWHKAIAELEAQ